LNPAFFWFRLSVHVDRYIETPDSKTEPAEAARYGSRPYLQNQHQRGDHYHCNDGHADQKRAHVTLDFRVRLARGLQMVHTA
jgi:hypothetical protein